MNRVHGWPVAWPGDRPPKESGSQALSPQDLRLLLAIDHDGSFTAAAQALGMTQSALG